MKELFVGTSNLHKIEEIEDIFKRNNIDVKILSPKDFNDNSNIIEDGFSFAENAEIKAKFYYDKYQKACLAEDSGICIEYLNNEPGIHSARFMPDLDVCQTNEYVLKLMKDVKNRKASFHAVICYIDDSGHSHFFEGINYGEISYEQKGSLGFGYDPIFYIPSLGKTEAELGKDYKDIYGHRAKAFQKFIEYLKNEKK